MEDQGWTRYTGETCGRQGCDAKVIRHIPADTTECVDGHTRTHESCPDCGEEIMSTHLGEFCGCGN